MKTIETNKHVCYHLVLHMNMNTIQDDESTVSYFDDYISERNMAAHQRRSITSSASNYYYDDDESTISTTPSTIHDDQSYIWNDDLFDCGDCIKGFQP